MSGNPAGPWKCVSGRVMLPRCLMPEVVLAPLRNRGGRSRYSPGP
jgi:hypothetical protein